MTQPLARLSAMIIAVSAVAACGDASGPAGGDASHDAAEPSDAAEADAPIPTDDSGQPPVPWEPGFAARRVFFDPEVTCPPTEGYAYASPPATASPGDVEWSIDPVRSAEWVGVVPDRDASRFLVWQAPLTLLRDGGLMAIAPEFGELGVAADGGPAFYFPFAPSEPYLGPHLVLPDGRTATMNRGRIWIQDPRYALPTIETLFARVPAGAPALVAPALTARGEILWAPDDRTVTASCVSDGRPRWLVEVDPHPAYRPIVTRPDSIDLGEQWRSIHVTDDGGVLLLVGPWLYRFDVDGEPIAEARVAPDDRIVDQRVWSMGLDATCGLAVDVGDRLHWYDPGTLELRHVIRYAESPGYAVRPLHDCSVLERTRSGFVVTNVAGERTRLTPSFSASFVATVQRSYDLPIELANGDLLFLMIGTPPTELALAIHRRGTPAPVIERLYRADEIGGRPVSEAYHVTPDGSLRIATAGSTGWRFSSIRLGTGPALPLLGRGTAIDPMHTNSLWASEALPGASR